MGRLFYEHNYNILVDALNSVDIPLENSKVLDFGCGTGGWLRLFVEMGARPENLTGVDLSASRVATAKQNNPAINWRQEEGDCISFPSSQFDLVMQIVVFSSIININLACTLLAELQRVTKPGGHILWIDHKKKHSDTLFGYSVEQLSGYLTDCSLVYRESVHPRYFRYRYKQPWLCRLLYNFTKTKCDAWLLVFRKER
jgi:ubiquinone/menaquinone biosynthesis C-methylase UbiE